MSDDQLADYAVGSPARLALNVLAHKWTLLIVVALKGGPQRFTRLRTQVPGVTSQGLRDSLRELARDGIVVPPGVRGCAAARRVHPHQPRGVPVRAGASHPGVGGEERSSRHRGAAGLRQGARSGGEAQAVVCPSRGPRRRKPRPPLSAVAPALRQLWTWHFAK